MGIGVLMIQLTDERFEKFQLNDTLIETIRPIMGGKSEIRLINGRCVVCIESPEKIAELARPIYTTLETFHEVTK